MRITLINQEHADFGGPGGAERSVQSIAEYFARAGHDVTFLAMVRRSYMRDMPENGIHSISMINGVRTVIMGRPESRNTHADLLLPVILAHRPDVIHVNVFHRAPQLWQALAPLGIPILHTLREYKLMCDRNMFDGVRDCGEQCHDCDLISNYAANTSKHVDGVVGISTFTLQRHLKRKFFPNAVVSRVIPNSYRPKTPPLDRVPRPPGTPIRIGFLGRMHASKGINLIIDVMSTLPPDMATLLMAGDLQDAAIAGRVEQLSRTHDARYIGFTDPASFLSEIDVLLAPSIWHEPFGRITIEAFAHSVPVITTNRGGLPDIVTNGETGWVFDPDEPDQLAAVIREVAAMPEQQLQQMRHAALAAAARYTPEIVGDMYVKVYEELVEFKAAKTSKTKVAVRTFFEQDAARHSAIRVMRTNLPPRLRRPLRVLVVTGEFPKLSETFVLNHITGLIDLGQDVRILYSGQGRADQIPRDFYSYELGERATSLRPAKETVKVIQDLTKAGRAAADRLASLDGRDVTVARELLNRGSEPLNDYHSFQAFNRAARNADIIHCHFGHRPRYIFRYLDLAGLNIPVVCSFHGIDVSAHAQKFGPGLYDDVKFRLHKALPVSNFFRDRLISYGFLSSDVQVHRVGIDTSKFSFQARDWSGDPVFRLLSVGRLVPKKGFEYGIRAVARALQLRPEIQLQYSIAGEGAGHDNLQGLIAELGLSSRVVLLGALPHQQITQLMSAAHVMLVPSVTGEDGDMEGIPTVTMEAMASGLPILATKHSGIPEAVIDGYCGLLSPERDSDGMAASIIQLHDNPGLGGQLGRRGRNHVDWEFNIARQNKKIVELYKEIVNGD